MPGTDPPASSIRTRQGWSGSAITRAAARSAESSAARDHLRSAKYMARTGKTEQE